MHWQKIVEDQHKSGLSVERYCRERNINPHTFKYWQIRIRSNPPLKNESLFLPVKIKNSEQGFTVKLPSGQITFLSEPNPTWFAKLLKELSHEECR